MCKELMIQQQVTVVTIYVKETTAKVMIKILKMSLKYGKTKVAWFLQPISCKLPMRRAEQSEEGEIQKGKCNLFLKTEHNNAIKINCIKVKSVFKQRLQVLAMSVGNKTLDHVMS